MGDGQPMSTYFPHCITLVTKRATYGKLYELELFLQDEHFETIANKFGALVPIWPL